MTDPQQDGSALPSGGDGARRRETNFSKRPPSPKAGGLDTRDTTPSDFILAALPGAMDRTTAQARVNAACNVLL
ncbi:MAG: hypothetical protein PVF51_08945, partial [Nitrospirota bacterium]